MVITTDYNEMPVEILMAIHTGLEISYEINDGKIVGTKTENGEKKWTKNA